MEALKAETTTKKRKRRRYKFLEFNNIGIISKSRDINQVNRNVCRSKRAYHRTKTRGQLPEEYIKRVYEIEEYEKKHGITDYCKDYEGNRLTTVNKFLYDTMLLPRERLCYRYIATSVQCRGRLKLDGIEVIVQYYDKAEDETFKEYKPYELYFNWDYIGAFKNQQQIVEWISKKIGYKEY